MRGKKTQTKLLSKLILKKLSYPFTNFDFYTWTSKGKILTSNFQIVLRLAILFDFAVNLWRSTLTWVKAWANRGYFWETKFKLTKKVYDKEEKKLKPQIFFFFFFSIVLCFFRHGQMEEVGKKEWSWQMEEVAV